MTDAVYSFLPWVRRGASTGITQAYQETAPARASFDVHVTVNPGSTNAPQETVPISLYGPGDVVGFDPARVLRTEPRPYTTDFEPNYLAAIEFDLPDFVWLMTPAKADATDKLMPWICLVVVPKAKATLSPGSNGTLPVLETNGAPLPDLTEAWAWAHSQVLGTLATGELDTLIETSPERIRSRLVCPRKLDANTAYYACVVPTTAAGRAAGLGAPVVPGTLTRAWIGDGTAGTTLPVYYHWEFATGAQGDFESLARLIHGRPAPPGTGRQHMDIREAGLGLQPALEANMGYVAFDGALLAPGLTDLAWTGDKNAFQDALADRIDEPATLTPAQQSQLGVVGPPLYGGAHVGKRTVPASGQSPAWLSTFNLEPAYRAVASLGARVIESDQERLMDAAWKQVGQIQAANDALRKAQLARSASLSLYSTAFKALTPGVLVQVAGIARSRLSLDAVQQIQSARTAATEAAVPAPRGTLEREVLRSRLPSAALTVAFRRIARPTGPVLARVSPRKPRPTVRPLAQLLNDGKIAGAPATIPPEGVVQIDAPGMETRSQHFTPAVVKKAPQQPNFVPLPPGTKKLPEKPKTTRDGESVPPEASPSRVVDNKAAASFRKAAIAMQGRLYVDPKKKPPAPPAPLSLPQLKATLLSRLDPRLTIPHVVKSRLTLPASPRTDLPRTMGAVTAFSSPAFLWDPIDPIEPILAAPVVDRPMYEPLRDLFKDAFLPGAGPLEPNSVMLLKTNPRFIEAYMVGLNHKFAQLLLWRGYPTDGRGTSFRQFWDSRGHVPAPTTEAQKAALLDIPPIHAWAASKAFGDHARGGVPGGMLVLLIAAELLNRYPNLAIYASEADRRPLTNLSFPSIVRQPKTTPNHIFPAFRGTLPPNVTFLGFELGVAKARGGPAPSTGSTDPDPGNGWFFVFEQPPTEPRFGLDVSRTGSLSWGNLSWNDMSLSSSHVAIGATRNALQAAGAPQAFSNAWAKDAGALAVQTLQSPFRVAISADDLLPAP